MVLPPDIVNGESIFVCAICPERYSHDEYIQISQPGHVMVRQSRNVPNNILLDTTFLMLLFYLSPSV